MPELPEAERARQVIEEALGRTIVAVDDTDTYVCRPHAPGEIAGALTGDTLVAAHRRGKSSGWRPPAGTTSGCTSAWPGTSSSTPRRTTGRGPLLADFEGGGRLALRDRRRLGRSC